MAQFDKLWYPIPMRTKYLSQHSTIQKIWTPIVNLFKRFDRRVDGAISFFFKHYGKTRFMISMSKRVQALGIEKVWNKGPKAFIYFFLFYLIRDTILYIIIPIFFARMTSN